MTNAPVATLSQATNQKDCLFNRLRAYFTYWDHSQT